MQTMGSRVGSTAIFGIVFLVVYHLLRPLVLDADRSTVPTIVITTLIAMAAYSVVATVEVRLRG